MDFFAHQDAARKRTGRLILLFGLSLIGIIAAVYVVAIMVVSGTSSDQGDGGVLLWFQPTILSWVSIGVLAVVGVASAGKMSALRFGGGASVASSLSGRAITHDTADPLEKRVLNVVEEMAIASGIPAPPVSPV